MSLMQIAKACIATSARVAVRGSNVHCRAVSAHHAFEPHTSEVEITLEATTLPELFAEAGVALAELYAGGGPPVAGPAHERVELSAPDRDALLVDWLNELVFLAERDGRLFTRFEFERLVDRDLVARAYWTAPPEFRSVVKAATFHNLHIRETPTGLEARVVLDV